MHIKNRILYLTKEDFNSLFDYQAVHIDTPYQALLVGFMGKMEFGETDFTFADFDSINIETAWSNKREGG